jgi:hydrogenase-1 operon protein HyaF
MGGGSCLDGTVTGMARSVLAEIVQRLEKLSESEQSSSIDLRGLPMTEADRAQLDDYLGRGEVHATLELSGRSEIWETRYPGVWWIRHHGIHDRIACEEIAVTPLPEILKSHPEDIRAAVDRLSAALDRLEAAPSPPTPNPQHDTEAPDVR